MSKPILLRALLLLFVILTDVVLSHARVTSKDLGSIWFIGDSITQSNADQNANSSPRLSLYNELTAAGGYTFSFTGHSTADNGGLPVTGGTAATNLYQYHSGISGSVIGNDVSGRVGMTQNMTTGTNFWNVGRLATVKPNLILIMLGTNDMNNNIDVANAPGRISTMIDTIFNLPGVGDPTIMVAQIAPNRVSTGATQRTADYNAALPAVINAQKSLGRDVYLVDHFTPLNANYSTYMLSDNLHPNTAGNNVIGANWFNAIQPLTVPEPATWAVLFTAIGVGSLAFRRGVRRVC